MFPLTITIHDANTLQRVLAVLHPTIPAAQTPLRPVEGLHPNEAKASAVNAGTPEPKPQAPKPVAAPPATDVVDYKTLSTAVLELMKAPDGAAKAKAILTGFGVANYSLIPEAKRAEALEQVQSALSEGVAA